MAHSVPPPRTRIVDGNARVEGGALDALQITLFEEQVRLFIGLAVVLLFAEWLWPDRRSERMAWAGRFE